MLKATTLSFWHKSYIKQEQTFVELVGCMIMLMQYKWFLYNFNLFLILGRKADNNFSSKYYLVLTAMIMQDSLRSKIW